MRNGSKFLILGAVLMAVLGSGVIANAALFTLPGVIPPSACRVGAVLSTDQFTSTGFSNVRTANPDDQIVAGAWVIANNYIPDTSVVRPPNCDFDNAGGGVNNLVGGTVNDDQGINLMGLRMVPTIASAAEAAITEVMLVWDINVNGLWDPLLDVVLQTKPGSDLDTQDGAVFWNGPQNPLAFLSNNRNSEAAPVNVDPARPFRGRCYLRAEDEEPEHGIGPEHGTNSRHNINHDGNEFRDESGCYIALLAVVKIGSNPTTGSQFGLEIEALAGDIPGTTGISSYTFSSGFSSSQNPQAANVRLHMVGGSPGSHTPLEHLSNASGAPESGLDTISFTGGQQGEGLLTRFRALEIVPGTREVIAMAVGLCDGAFLANTNAAILPSIAGAPPTIAGGLSSLPCIPSAGTDGYATGINGATLIFRGPLARYMGTVRMYVDECYLPAIQTNSTEPLDPADFDFNKECVTRDEIDLGLSSASVEAQGGNEFVRLRGGFTLATIEGGGDGFLFQPGELTEQVVPIFNEQTGEAIAQFGGRQEQILFTGNGNPVAHGSDPIGEAFGIDDAGTRPLIIIWTVDVDQNAPGGPVDVLMGLQSFDDTAIAAATPGLNPCRVFAFTAPAVPTIPGAKRGGVCGSNFSTPGPAIYSFAVEGPEHPSTPNSLAAYDTNNSCFIDDPEFFAAIDAWVDGQLGDTLFFELVDAWVAQTNVCNLVSSASVNALSLNSVSLETNAATNATTFVASGQSINAMSVEVFSMNGNVIFSQEAAGTHLTWNQANNSGAPVANGTYLYVVTVSSADGQTLQSEVNKLVVIR